MEKVAVEIPLPRGGHTQIAAFGVFFQKPVASVVVVSFLDIEPHELSRSSFSAGGWKCVFANGGYELIVKCDHASRIRVENSSAQA